MRLRSIDKALTRLTQTGFRIFFFTCLVFAVLTSPFSLWLSLAEIAVVLILYLYLHIGMNNQKNEVLSYLESMAINIDTAADRAMTDAPIPMVIYRPDSDEVIWSNDLFLRITGNREHLFQTRLAELVPSFQSQWLLKGEHTCPDPVDLGDSQYLVFGTVIPSDDQDDLLAITYWVDVTEYTRTAQEYHRTRPALLLLQLDNYDDIVRGLSEESRSAILSEIGSRISLWADSCKGMLCRYNRDHFLLLIDSVHLNEVRQKKFSILDSVRSVQNSSGVSATLSIGIGYHADTPQQLMEFASLALEMALSRGGDQAVLKNPADFIFVGGRSKETERRTKVKSRVIANALSDLLNDRHQLLVMGHKFPDLDVMGAVAGICAIARKKNVNCHVVRAPSPYPAEQMANTLMSLPEYIDIFISPEEALHLASPETVLVVVDTNRPEQTQLPELLSACGRIVVIDHHRRATSYISDPFLSFHDPYASSASELVTELVQYILDNGDLKRAEAEALLAGIVLDTKSFSVRTGTKTFETAALLRRSGADISNVNHFFQSNLSDTVSKFEIIRQAKTYLGTIAIACTDRYVGRVIAGQAADELLKISGIEASFVLFPESGMTHLSARSRSELNVHVICEALGGGGNAATAGAQFPGRTPEDILPDLTEAIDNYFKD